jgi:hypothetical protein
MRAKLTFGLTVCAILLATLLSAVGSEPIHLIKTTMRSQPVASGSPAHSWYFAVSGDSRDCGDLIMPKIAQAIESNRAQTPTEFYWHLGDFRAMWRIDCDIAKRRNPAFQCEPDKRDPKEITAQEKTDYQGRAWDDFLEHQVMPFGATSVVLGIGNHELIDRTRNDFRLKFKQWLTQPMLVEQRTADAKRGISSAEGDTYYHFVKNGVDFIYLDNAGNDYAFSNEQIVWLSQVLAADGKDKKVKTIIVGMHAALPFSLSRNHAMDASCPGICSGQRVYNMLYDAPNLNGPVEKRKHVYVLASHSHYYEQNIYDTPEHMGRVLPGWIIGTAGAEQYRDTILYGYMQMEVRADGTLNAQFKEVKRDDLPLASGLGASELTSFCFEQNKRPVTDTRKSDCRCDVNE